ncbi:MAG: hypothetical protein HQL42_09845 [Alphaproteobacteria bacterium]|nr:hypothetical protein [Alphaproteobacteria bacterium]
MFKAACSPATPFASRGTGTVMIGNRSRRCHSAYLGNAEPDLHELLGDEVLRRMMTRDGVEPEMVLALVAHMQEMSA